MRSYKQILVTMIISNSLLTAKLEHTTKPESFQQIVVTNKQPSLVAFTAEWCQVCQEIKPKLHNLATDPAYAHINFIDVDTTQMHKLTEQYGIVAVPTLIYFKNGKPVQQMIGVHSIENFIQDVQTNLHKLYPQTRTQIDLDADIENHASLATHVYKGVQHFLVQLCTTLRRLCI